MVRIKEIISITENPVILVIKFVYYLGLSIFTIFFFWRYACVLFGMPLPLFGGCAQSNPPLPFFLEKYGNILMGVAVIFGILMIIGLYEEYKDRKKI